MTIEPLECTRTMFNNGPKSTFNFNKTAITSDSLDFLMRVLVGVTRESEANGQTILREKKKVFQRFRIADDDGVPNRILPSFCVCLSVCNVYVCMCVCVHQLHDAENVAHSFLFLSPARLLISSSVSSDSPSC